ncbi:MAG: alpha-hydroxy-acid oxidizing protein [Syntrophobacterales bacterium]|jgi:isopentenyl diphosphate isomerase/L-lactate dehydrogenase-like FMN-dependent dehydrogenase|nr:alpha-hydroxy-acid oxidizing protein [Syntrophobacterales bacterium]
MNLAELRENAKEKLKGYCRVCPVCNGRACAGEVPGMGGAGTGAAFAANLEALSRYRFNMRTLHDVKAPDTSLTLWGETLGMPILAAPMTGVAYNMGGKISEEGFLQEIIAGSLLAGTLGMSGDGADPEMYNGGLKAIAAHQGKGIPVAKPRAQAEAVKYLKGAEEAGALAVGMDIDGAGLITMALKGQPVGPKSFDEIKELIASTRLPFILKGVMTPEEAEMGLAAGAAAIVVSNHGGRVLDHTPGAAEVLPRIAARVEGRMLIFADGGVRSGSDVLKLLALGADAVLVGRPLVIGVLGGGREGVAFLLNKLKNELIQAMLLTGTASVKTVSRAILYDGD